MKPNFQSAEVELVFAEVPPRPRARLLRLRQLIFETARAEDVAPVKEALRWGQPS